MGSSPLRRLCLQPYDRDGYVLRRKSTAFYYFNIVLLLSLLGGLIFYFQAVPQRLFIAAPPMIAGIALAAVNLVCLSRGKYAQAAATTAVAAALILATAQMFKLQGDYHTAYNSFAYFYLLPVLIAGLFSRKYLILLLSAFLLAVNIIFYVIASQIGGANFEVVESLAVGFVSSSLILGLGAVLLFHLRQIIDRALDDITANNRSMQRFVPFGFMRALGKSSVSELGLGDHIRQIMTVMFCDLRNFTSLSEEVDDAKMFALLNRYFGVMGPIIRGHRGFVDKYIGDAIMAVFRNADDALSAAESMEKALVEFNREAGTNLDFGIGMDTGLVSLGTVGERRRIEGTVISDTVNTASRIEGLTKEMGRRILLSGNTADGLGDRSRVHFLTSAQVKGKSGRVQIFSTCGDLQ